MQLSDIGIKQALFSQEIIIKDFDENRLQPASYDVLLGFEFMIFNRHQIEVIDPKKPFHQSMTTIKLESEDDYFVLHPGEFALGVTWDFFGVGANYACQIVGKSSLARYGLIVHTTAGFVDPGNALNATLEFYNTNSLPIKLYPKMKIAQIIFYKLLSPAQKLYGHQDLNSKYYGSTTVEASQMYRNFVKNNKLPNLKMIENSSTQTEQNPKIELKESNLNLPS
jgi:dCTP deaminase